LIGELIRVRPNVFTDQFGFPPSRTYQILISGCVIVSVDDKVSSTERNDMKSYQQPPSAESKKTGMKERHSPYDPYREKARGKETRPGFYEPSPRPRARVRGRYAAAGAAADELIDILGGQPSRDRGTWAYYCYHHDIEILLDKAYEIASRHRQGEIKNPVTAVQRWLMRSFGKEAV